MIKGSWKRGIRRREKRAIEVKALVAVSSLPRSTYAMKVRVVTRVGVAMSTKALNWRMTKERRMRRSSSVRVVWMRSRLGFSQA